MPRPPTDVENLTHATKLARDSGMYIVPREELHKGKPVVMYLLFRRLQFASHGTLIGRRNSTAGILKLVQKAKVAV